MGGVIVLLGKVSKHGLWSPPHLPSPFCPAFSPLEPLLFPTWPPQGLNKGLAAWVVASAPHDLYFTACDLWAIRLPPFPELEYHLVWTLLSSIHLPLWAFILGCILSLGLSGRSWPMTHIRRCSTPKQKVLRAIKPDQIVSSYKAESTTHQHFILSA